MTDGRKVPQGRLARLSQYASLGAKAGISILGKRSQQSLATETANVLGNMRGLAAKIGQIASYVDGLVPEQSRDTFEGALSKLRSSAVRSPFSDV
ncbi:MAG: hypothetical protein HOV80_11860, partial [Polyangiaceae bacterium]|nr:hypothetical protein [Polyangiaceae bacterium]